MWFLDLLSFVASETAVTRRVGRSWRASVGEGAHTKHEPGSRAAEAAAALKEARKEEAEEAAYTEDDPCWELLQTQRLSRNEERGDVLVRCMSPPAGIKWYFTLNEAASMSRQYAEAFMGDFAFLTEQNKYVMSLAQVEKDGKKIKARGKDGGPLMLLNTKGKKGSLWNMLCSHEIQHMSTVHDKKLVALQRRKHFLGNCNPFYDVFGRYSFLMMPCDAEKDECSENEDEALYTIEKWRFGGHLQNLIGLTSTAQRWSIYEGNTKTNFVHGQNEAMRKNQRYKVCNYWSTTHIYRCFETCHNVKCRKYMLNERNIKDECSEEKTNDCIAAIMKQEMGLSFLIQGLNDKFNLEIFPGQDAMLMATIAMAIDRRNDAAQREGGGGVDGWDVANMMTS